MNIGSSERVVNIILLVVNRRDGFLIDELYDQFLSARNFGEGRKRHYEVLRRMIHRYQSYIRCSTGRKRYVFDALKVDKDVLDSLYDYIENEFEYVEKFPKILEDNPEAREIKPRGENYMMVSSRKSARSSTGRTRQRSSTAFPFESSERFNDNIKIIFEKAGGTYLVTELDTLTRTEKKVPINEIASSHMARRTFIGNIYKLVKDPNLVSALTGHAEGSRAFNRYRDIDIDMKRDLVKILEGKH